MLKSIILLNVVVATIAIPTHPSRKTSFGSDADIADYPWQISLEWWGGMFCGGFLISKNWAVTSGRCMSYAPDGYKYIRAGSNSAKSDGEIIKIANIYIHPNYTISTFQYDISVIQLEKDVTISTAEAAILPDVGQEILEGDSLVVTGWGSATTNPTTSKIQEVIVTVVNQQACESIYNVLGYVEDIITESTFCAGKITDLDFNNCQADHGGPAVIDGKVVGITTWEYPCAKPGFPGIYSKVDKFRNWIKETTGV